MKVFSNMRRITKGFSRQEVDLFPNMLDPAEPSPSQHSPPQPGTEYPPPTPHDSPLHAV
ncbi:hypothetical protein Tco_0521584, partial [Tanacetum coccineum]